MIPATQEVKVGESGSKADLGKIQDLIQKT
jgi:hypothetical protein